MGGVSNKCSTYTTDLKLEEVIAGFGCLKFGSDTMYFTLVRVAVNRKCTASRTGKFTKTYLFALFSTPKMHRNGLVVSRDVFYHSSLLP
jgi:hypothetical protein